jgi:photosystem II stability/assembly factor-like uncharacterized protein
MRKGLLLFFCFFTLFGPLKAQWTKCNMPAGAVAFSLTVSGDNLYLGTLSNGVYLSTDKGASWKEINTGITNKQIWSIAVIGNTLFAGTAGGGLFRSTDNGSNWTAANNGISATTIIRSVVKFNNKLFATSTNQGIYVTTDNGNSWTKQNTGIVGLVAQPLLVTESELYTGVLQSVYKYDATNDKWVAANSGIVNNTISSLAYTKDKAGVGNLFAGVSNSGSNVFRSVNSGTSWTGAGKGLPPVPVATIAAVGTTLFAGNDYGVYISKDMGDNWTDASTGFQLASYATFLSAGSQELYVLQSGAVWKRSLADFGITSVKNLETENYTRLLQNYPNPFNSQTTISYELSNAEQVKLAVYDLSGRQLFTVIEGYQGSGIYSYRLSTNEQELAPGIYFYKLEAGNSTQTRKMMITK